MTSRLDEVWMLNTTHWDPSVLNQSAPPTTDAASWADLNDTGPVTSSSASAPDMLTRFVVETCVALPVSVVGTVGNVLAIIVLQKQRQRLSTTLLLQVLAVADTGVLISTVLLRSLRYLYHYGVLYYGHFNALEPYMDVYHYIFCGLFPFVYFIRLTGTWITVLLTIDRYIAVRFPLHAHHLCTMRRAMRHVIILSFVSLLFSLPRFFEYQIDTSSKFGFVPTDLLLNRTYTIAYRIVLFFTFMYLIPMLLLILLNAHLLITLRVADSYRARVSDSKSTKTNRNITATVVTVVLVTIVCNVSAMLSHLLWSLQQCFAHLAHVDMTRRYLSLASNIFVTLNSAINFFIYSLCSRNFRIALRQMCACGSRGVRRWRRGLSRTDTASITFQTSCGSGTYIPLTASSVVRKSLRGEKNGAMESTIASRTYH